MSEEQIKDTSVCIGRFYAEPHEETPNEQRVRRALKLLLLVEDLVPEGIAVAIRGNRATFRAERDGKAYELAVTSKEGTHVLDCAMTATRLHAAAQVCRKFMLINDAAALGVQVKESFAAEFMTASERT